MYVHVSVITRYSNTVTFALNYFRINAERRLNGLASVEHWRNLARTGKVLNKYQTEVEVKLGRDTGIFYGKERTYEIETSGTVSRKISRASLSYQAFSPSKPRGCAWKTFFSFLNSTNSTRLQYERRRKLPILDSSLNNSRSGINRSNFNKWN